MSEETEQREQGRDVAGLVFLAVTGLAIVGTLVWFAIRADRAMQSELADARASRAGRKPCRCHETAEESSPVGDDTESAEHFTPEAVEESARLAEELAELGNEAS